MNIDFSYRPYHVRFYHGEWYTWKNGVWRQMMSGNDRDAVLRAQLYRDLSNKTVRHTNKDGSVKILPYNPDKPKLTKVIDALLPHCLVEDCDPPCWLKPNMPPCDPGNVVFFRNGILDVKEYMQGRVKLTEGGLDFFNLTVAPYEFDPEAQCPVWHKFLNEIFDGDPERIGLLQEWFGYNLVADTSLEKLMMFLGRPGSGKSTVLGVMRAMVGPDNCGATTFKDLCTEFGLQSLIHKNSILLPDAHVPRQVDAVQALERIKSIVGQDRITVNRKFLPILSDVKLPGRMTIVMNELPDLPDSGRALERRLLLISFPRTFQGREDWTLKDRLITEAPGVAVWALDGLKRLRQQDRFTGAQSSESTMRELCQVLTPLMEFIHECCVIEPNSNAWSTKQQLFTAWSRWSRDQGRAPGNKFNFGRLLAQDPIIETARRRVNGRQATVYQNIRLTREAQDRYLI